MNHYVSGHYSSFCLFTTHTVSETGLCLRLKAKRTQMGPIDRTSP
jgi:hypothetical protein